MKKPTLILILLISSCSYTRYADYRSNIIQHNDYAYLVSYCKTPQFCYNGIERQCFNGYEMIFDPKDYSDYLHMKDGRKIFFYYWSKAKCYGQIGKEAQKKHYYNIVMARDKDKQKKEAERTKYYYDKALEGSKFELDPKRMNDPEYRKAMEDLGMIKQGGDK